MSKVRVSEGSISVSGLQGGDSFDIDLTDTQGNTALFRYTVPEGGADIILSAAGLDGNGSITPGGDQSSVFAQETENSGEYSGKIKIIHVVLKEGDLVENYSPESTGELAAHAESVEFLILKDSEQLGEDPTEMPVPLGEAEFYLKGSFERAEEKTNEGTPDTDVSLLYRYDKDNQTLCLSGSFLCQDLFQENAYSQPLYVNEVLVRSVDESEWTEVWNKWTGDNRETPDPGISLTISGTGADRFFRDDGTVTVIIDSDGSPEFRLGPAGGETPAAVIFSKAAGKADVSVARENDALELEFTSPHILTTEDTVWRFDDGDRLIVTGFDEQSWDSVIRNKGISGEFSILGGTARVNNDGTREISGTPGDEVRLEFPAATQTVLVQYDGRTSETPELPLLPLILGGALVVACGVIAALAGRCHKLRKRLGSARERDGGTAELPASQDWPQPSALRVGRLQNIGKRPGQQDSMGVISVPGGVFAVVADGMGGLSDGDKVSQKIVQTMLGDANNRRADQIADNMAQLVAHANSEVNQMLGYSSQYKSGSTLLAVLAEPGRFHWIAVGDSRIYLYRGGSVIQMNHEHVLEVELVTKAVNREMSFQEARGNRKKGSVTSFIGMGELRYIDMSLGPVALVPGDKILLMSDGVFNTLSEPELARLLETNPDPAQAAKAIEAGVLSRNRPHQDNFSCIIIDYS